MKNYRQRDEMLNDKILTITPTDEKRRIPHNLKRPINPNMVIFYKISINESYINISILTKNLNIEVCWVQF